MSRNIPVSLPRSYDRASYDTTAPTTLIDAFVRLGLSGFAVQVFGDDVTIVPARRSSSAGLPFVERPESELERHARRMSEEASFRIARGLPLMGGAR